MEWMQDGGTQEEGVDGLKDGWILVKDGRKGWMAGCNGGERRAGKAK